MKIILILIASLLPWTAYSIGPLALFPPQSCEQAWEGHGAQDYNFRYDLDATSSPTSDLGYSNYLTRLTQLKMASRTDCFKDWTVLVYMSVTPDLVSYAYADLLEMEFGKLMETDIRSEGRPEVRNDTPSVRGSSLRTDVLVHLDQGKAENSVLHIFEAPEERYSQLPKTVTPETISSLQRSFIQSPTVKVFGDDVPPTQRERLQSFLKWGITQYPSQHFMVIVWGHGQGWAAKNLSPLAIQALLANLKIAPTLLKPSAVRMIGSSPLDSQNSAKKRVGKKFGGIGVESPSSFLDLPELKAVLEEVKKWSDDNPIDIFASDACLMQSIEDVSHLSKCANFICGSEDIQSFAGFPYGSLLYYLNSNHSNPYRIAKIIPQLYKESFSPGSGTQYDLDPEASQYLTCSSVWTKHFHRSLLPALGNLGNALLSYLDERDSANRFLRLMTVRQKGPFFDGGTQDLGQVLMNLEDLVAEEISVQGAQLSGASVFLQQSINQVRLALMNSLAGYALGSNYQLSENLKQRSGPVGLSIWMPELNEEYHARIEDYRKSTLYLEQTGWKNLMNRIYPKILFMK